MLTERLASVVALLALLLPGPARAEPVALELVLAIDSSGSVDSQEFDLQLEGIAGAFRDPRVVAAIEKTGSLAVTLLQWSSPGHQRITTDWTIVTDAVSAAGFAAALEAAGRQIEGETAIAPALRFAVGLLEDNGLEGTRRVIDLSGDGASNWGEDPDAMRDAAVALGITVNGLAISNEQPALADYYRRHVVGGEGAFLIEARDYVDFARAMRRKLIREIEGTPVGDDARPDDARGRASLCRESIYSTLCRRVSPTVVPSLQAQRSNPVTSRTDR